MTQLLEKIHAEIRERLQRSEAAVKEYELLEAALAALGGPVADREPRPAAAPAAPARRAAPKSRRASAASRAPRGANREAVLRVLAERPGVSATELSSASGVERTVLYALLNRLVERGEVLKESLPGGTSGFSLPREPSAFPAPAPAPESPPVEEPAATDQEDTGEKTQPESAAA
jgi:hypothetical protein